MECVNFWYWSFILYVIGNRQESANRNISWRRKWVHSHCPWCRIWFRYFSCCTTSNWGMFCLFSLDPSCLFTAILKSSYLFTSIWRRLSIYNETAESISSCLIQWNEHNEKLRMKKGIGMDFLFEKLLNHFFKNVNFSIPSIIERNGHSIQTRLIGISFIYCLF